MAARGPKPGGWVVVVTFRGDVVDRLSVPRWLAPDVFLRAMQNGPTPDAPTR